MQYVVVEQILGEPMKQKKPGQVSSTLVLERHAADTNNSPPKDYELWKRWWEKFKARAHQPSTGYSFLKVRICCLSLFYMVLNLRLKLLLKPIEPFENITLGSGEFGMASFSASDTFIDRTEHQINWKIMETVSGNEINQQLQPYSGALFQDQSVCHILGTAWITEMY